MTLIGLYSPYPQSGKSTFAKELLTTPGSKLAKFADPIREVVVPFAAEFLPGGEAEVLQWLDDDRKDTRPIPGLNVTLRHMMQTQGTWARNAINPDLYVKIMQRRIRYQYDNYKLVVVDDVRFENEYAMLRQRGCWLIRVDRPDPPDTVEHESNARLDHLPFDYSITNNGTMEDLRAKARVVAWDLGLTNV